MKRRVGAATAALLLFLAAPRSTRPQSPPPEKGPLPRAAATPAFSGRYRLGLAFGTSCPAKGPVVSIEVEIAEAAVGSRVEVDGRPKDPEDAAVSRLVLLREGDHLHGAVSVKGDLEVLGVGTLEGQRVWMQLMADGTASTSGSGKVLASGRAFGDLQVSRPGDDSRDTLGSCTARDHAWSLEPF
jgi:hypothetical protein